MGENERIRAACLTAPSAGGVAVVQVFGPRASELVTPFLRSRRPIDWAKWDSANVRLCQWSEGDEIIDDALVTFRDAGPSGQTIDLCFHGGPRIVQRVLLGLRAAGVELVEGPEALQTFMRTCGVLEGEILHALLSAQTRAVAEWLARMIQALPAFAEQVLVELDSGNREAARRIVADCLQRGEVARYLLEGARVVLAGEPNVGKSTLANALAGQEMSIVSDIPGTTRDWVDHRGAVAGIPFTFVDTAGVRDTEDLIEREAIRRSRQEFDRADVILRVLDASRPPSPAKQEVSTGEKPPAVMLFVWNKCDLPLDPKQEIWIAQAGKLGYRVSARTGQGLGELQQGLCRVLNLDRWHVREPAPFTPRQRAVLHQVYASLEHESGGPFARAWLRSLVSGREPSEDSAVTGYNRPGSR